MTKTELIRDIAERTNLTLKDSEFALAAFVDSITRSLKKGDRVQITGFGTFEAKKRAARTAFNPKTKKQITVPESVVPAFRVGKTFRNEIR
jgi:DNA-binding protein HU-beta